MSTFLYKELVKKYLDTYYPNTDEDTKDKEYKRVKGLIKKLTAPDSVFKGIPLNYMNTEEQINLLHFLLEEVPERQIISNANRVNADRDFYDLKIKDKLADQLTNCILTETLPNYEPFDIKEGIQPNRLLIRHSTNQKELFNSLNHNNEVIIHLLFDELSKFTVLGLGYENLQYIEDYIDYTADGLLQLLVYGVINNEKVDTEYVIQGLIEEIHRLSNLINIQLERKRKEQKDSDILTSTLIMRYFPVYLSHRNRYFEELGIKETLKEEVNCNLDFLHVSPDYQAPKVRLPEEDIKDSINIITEGQQIYNYEEKLEITRKFIGIMSTYGGRQCYTNCLQDLKVYFREIFVSRATYKRQQTFTIVKDYITKVNQAIKSNNPIPQFDRKSQYLFVREKISRGYFREKGLLLDYFAKMELEKELYTLLLNLYLFFDFKDTLEFIYEINHNLLKKFNLLLKHR